MRFAKILVNILVFKIRFENNITRFEKCRDGTTFTAYIRRIFYKIIHKIFVLKPYYEPYYKRAYCYRCIDLKKMTKQNGFFSDDKYWW